MDSGAAPDNAMRIVVVEAAFPLEDAPVQKVLDEGKSKYDLFAEGVQKELLASARGRRARLLIEPWSIGTASSCSSSRSPPTRRSP